MVQYSIVIPTYNGGHLWEECVSHIRLQKIKPEEVLVIDSSSSDNTLSTARINGCRVLEISQDEFNHGATRTFAANNLKNIPVVLFLTQDSLLADAESIEKLLHNFKSENIGAVYGKQLPRNSATQFEINERNFTYSSESHIYSYDDRKQYGMKTCFLSNAFTAYRMDALKEVGGFPDNAIVSEDMYVGAKLLKAGWKLAYCAEAAVVHSHSYTLIELFGRYFDIGVFNVRESWIREEFGTAENEGIKYVKSELGVLFKKAPWLIPYAIVRTGVKYLGFKLGLKERYLPVWVKRMVSRQKNYWN